MPGIGSVQMSPAVIENGMTHVVLRVQPLEKAIEIKHLPSGKGLKKEHKIALPHSLSFWFFRKKSMKKPVNFSISLPVPDKKVAVKTGKILQ
jgi:hypothetical protein